MDPRSDQLGPQNIIVRVTDSQGGFATQSYSVTVRGVNRPPSITSAAVTQASVGVVYAYAVRASDPDGDPLTFSLSTAPAGMAIDPQTGLVLWAPADNQTGSQAAVVEVTDDQGGRASQRYQITVAAGAQNRPPALTSTPPFVATVGQTYRYTLVATDPDLDALTFSALAGPTGLTVNPASGLVEWTPAPGQLGPALVTLAATDVVGNVATQTYTITVLAANRPPVITSAPVVSAPSGGTYRYDVRASDPDRDPLSFRLTVAPPGMTVDDLGRVRGPCPPVRRDVNGSSCTSRTAAAAAPRRASTSTSRPDIEARAWRSPSSPTR